MKPVRIQALKLRLSGKSYNEITAALGIPKATLSGWFRGLVLSKSARERLSSRVRMGTLNGLVKRNKMQTHLARQRAHAYQEQGAKKVPALAKKDLLFIGAILYWAEGYKRLKVENGKERTQHIISFVNSDPEMIRVFVRFLREVMNIASDRILLTMRLYPHINEKEAQRFWMHATSLPLTCFRKTSNMITGASKGKRPFNRLPFGTLQVSVNSTNDFHILMGMIKGVKDLL